MKKLREEIYGKDAQMYKDPTTIYQKNDIKIDNKQTINGIFYKKSTENSNIKSLDYKKWKSYANLPQNSTEYQNLTSTDLEVIRKIKCEVELRIPSGFGFARRLNETTDD